MANLPTDRDTADSAADHVADHNTLHAFHNLIDAKGDLIVGTAADTAGKKAVGTNGHVLTADSAEAGGVKWAAPSGTSVRVAFANRTGGSYTLNSTSWANVDTGLDLTLTAVSGDKIEVGFTGKADSEAVAAYLNVATIVSASPVNHVVSAGASDEGVAAWYFPPSVFVGQGGSTFYTLQAGDVSGGNVVLRLRYRTNTGSNKTLFGTTAHPLQFWAKNYGQ